MESTATAPSTLIRVSINQLVHSPLNVRKKQSTGISELAALIFSQGLIQNLVVVTQRKKNKPTGKYEVIAGSRRFDALQMLVADGRYRKEQEVDCRLVDEVEAKAMSLAENSGREAMHPADLVVAYRDLSWTWPTGGNRLPRPICRMWPRIELSAWCRMRCHRRLLRR